MGIVLFVLVTEAADGIVDLGGRMMVTLCNVRQGQGLRKGPKGHIIWYNAGQSGTVVVDDMTATAPD